MQEATQRENPGVTLGWLYIVIQHKVLAKLQTIYYILYTILYTHTHTTNAYGATAILLLQFFL